MRTQLENAARLANRIEASNPDIRVLMTIAVEGVMVKMTTLHRKDHYIEDTKLVAWPTIEMSLVEQPSKTMHDMLAAVRTEYFINLGELP